MPTDPQQQAATGSSPRGAPAGWQWTTMSVYRRRTLIVAAAILIVVAAFVAAVLVDRLGARIDPFQVAWATLSVEIVAAVYKWGVGGWSRYTPPVPSRLSAGEPPVGTTLPGVASSSPSSSMPADP